MKILKKILYNLYFNIKHLGYSQTIKYFIKKFLGKKQTTKIKFKENKYFIRTYEHDLDVLISNLNKEFEFLKNINLSQNQIIIDAGAYIGTSSIRLSQIFKKNKIIAIEPFKENYDIMLKNIQKYENIIPLNSALVSTGYMDEVFLYKSKTGAWGNNILKNTFDERNIGILNKINKIDLISLINKYEKKISILKLDIEGSEKMIFENDVNILSDIDIIIVELHKKINQDIEKIFFSFAKDRWNLSLDSEKLVSIKKK